MSILLRASCGLSWVLVVCGLSLGACSSPSAGTCVPGATVHCACPGGATGVQTCQRDGTLGFCVCQAQTATMPVAPVPPTGVPVPPPTGMGAPPPTAMPAPLPAIPTPSDGLAPGASQRKQAWLGSKFNCKAISTTKFRPCRFERTDKGYRLKFAHGTVCEDVEFDSNGDPETLLGCRSDGKTIPRKNALKRKDDIWSGSHGGWRWRGGGKYCCPGMWLQAPKPLR